MIYIVFNAVINAPKVSELRNAITNVFNNGADSIYLAISSTGGDVFEGLNIAAFIKSLPIKVITHNINQIDSVANVIFAAGKERVANTHATFLFHGVSMGVNANLPLHQLKGMYDHGLRLSNSIAANHAAYINVDVNIIDGLMQSGERIVSSNEAISLHLIDRISEFSIPQGAQIIVIGN